MRAVRYAAGALAHARTSRILRRGELRPGHSPRAWKVTMRLSRNRIQLLDARAARMRHEPTSSEARLFEALRGGRLRVAFRRQVPLAGRFIADFYAPELRLVVEVDGGYHAERSDADARRDRALARHGYHVLRLDATLVMSDLAAAVERVRAAIAMLRLSETK